MCNKAGNWFSLYAQNTQNNNWKTKIINVLKNHQVCVSMHTQFVTGSIYYIQSLLKLFVFRKSVKTQIIRTTTNIL